MVASGNPIIIEQNYHNWGSKNGILSFAAAYNSYQGCHLSRPFVETQSQSGNGKGVKVSDVRYARIRGSSASDEAITLNCDENLGCADIVMDHVDMVSATSGHKVFASCKNAYGNFFDSLLSCLKKY